MKYKIAICDDSQADRQFVGNIVSRWAASAGHAVHTDTFISAEDFKLICQPLVADTDGKYYELWNAQAQYYTE